MKQILDNYYRLLDFYGPQGWWPLINYEGTNPTKTGSIKGYHLENYDLPISRDEVFEVIIGAILTQNTSWMSVEKALHNLNQVNAINPEELLGLDDEVLKSCIKPAGFMNQKAKYLKGITEFYIKLNNNTPTRNELLKIKGIGNETADSILLYAYKKPEFVIDTYTKRITKNLGYSNDKTKYMELKELFQNNLPQEVPIYMEYHALLIEHAKNHYTKKPYPQNDPLLK